MSDGKAGRWDLSVQSLGAALQDEFDDFLGYVVGQAEVGACDCDEADDDCGGLGDLAAVRPLYALELRPARREEADDAIATANGSAGGVWATAAVIARAPATPGAATGGRAAGPLGLLQEVLAAILELPAGVFDGRFGGHATGPTDEGGIELVDLPGHVVEGAREILADGLAG